MSSKKDTSATENDSPITSSFKLYYYSQTHRCVHPHNDPSFLIHIRIHLLNSFIITILHVTQYYILNKAYKKVPFYMKKDRLQRLMMMVPLLLVNPIKHVELDYSYKRCS
jgi:hypothetical protein